jgi:hypothetical protein
MFQFTNGYNNEMLTFNEALTNHVYTTQGYVHPLDELSFKTEDFDKFIQEVKLDFEIQEYDFSDTKKNIYRQFEGEKIVIFAFGNSKNISSSIMTKELKDLESIFKIYTKYDTEDEEIKVYSTSYFLEAGAISTSGNIMEEKDLGEIDIDYYPYIDTNIMFEQLITNQENIFILAGEPGTGKSKMINSLIKFVMKNPDLVPYNKLEFDNIETQFIKAAFIKGPETLAQERFWRELESNEYDFVFMDDLDFMLTKRDSEIQTSEDQLRNSFLSYFLSFTDGVQKSKTKFVITTNQTFKDIDTALLRKGRLFDILELRKLDKTESIKIWKKNGLKEEDFPFDVHEISPAELGSEIVKMKNTRIENPTRPYLKEDGISKMQRSKKRVGF